MSERVEYRIDRGSSLRSPRRNAAGSMICDAYVRVADRELLYADASAPGGVRREICAAVECFDSASLESYNAIVITMDHPDIGMLTPETATRYQRGVVMGAARRDGDFVAVTMAITAADLIQSIERGDRLQCSLGYHTAISPRGPGEPALQRNVVANHCAVLAMGRAGADIRIRTDHSDGALVEIARADSFDPFAPATGALVTTTTATRTDAERMLAELEQLVPPYGANIAAKIRADALWCNNLDHIGSALKYAWDWAERDRADRAIIEQRKLLVATQEAQTARQRMIATLRGIEPKAAAGGRADAQSSVDPRTAFVARQKGLDPRTAEMRGGCVTVRADAGTRDGARAAMIERQRGLESGTLEINTHGQAVNKRTDDAQLAEARADMTRRTRSG